MKLTNVARFIPPMRPRMVSSLPADNSKWIYEPKLDGYRALAVRDGRGTTLYSIEGRSFNARFPYVQALDRMSRRGFVLDGELVALEPTGRPNFNELQNASRTKLPIHYVAFDILHYEGRDLFQTPLELRKEILTQFSSNFLKPLEQILVFSEDLELETIVAAVRRVRVEGLLAKRKGSKYEPGIESDLWQKHRFNQEDTFFLGGYIAGPRGVGELLIGEFRDDGNLYFVKRLIAGLNAYNRQNIFDAIQDLRSPECPFVNLPEKASEHQHAITAEVMRKCIWLRPEQPAEIEFIERTPHRRLRHASFRRLLLRSRDK